MKSLLAAALVGTFALSGCSTINEMSYRDSVDLTNCTPLDQIGQTNYDVQGFIVRVPRSMRVSEANSIHPDATIVWRGEPLGDRHAQVHTIVSDAARDAFDSSNGGTPAVVDMNVTFFHAMSDRTRATTGGWHTVNFDLALRDPDTNELLRPVEKVVTQITGFGGEVAERAVVRGETQKYRIKRHLTQVLEVAVLGICPTPYPAPVPLDVPLPPMEEIPPAVQSL